MVQLCIMLCAGFLMKKGSILITALMKFICIMLSVQTVMIVLLFIKMGSLETRLVKPAQPSEQTESQKPLAVTTPSDGRVGENKDLTGSQVRRIIREELGAISANSESLAANSQSAKEPPVFDEVEMQYRSELVIEQLELLKAQDEVSSGEIESLIGEIAQLDPERRSAMMKVLNGAINRGEIKSHL